ncbi:hypothetical protein ABT093_03165 [Kitasatospora sp. NPDC002551]|uniref:hypothetical protein n=1 Tax=unclassified Kitasatospora TaxID=2633591 RepID=UPI0033169169
MPEDRTLTDDTRHDRPSDAARETVLRRPPGVTLLAPRPCAGTTAGPEPVAQERRPAPAHCRYAVSYED